MSEENEQIAQRQEKLSALRETGNAFPNQFRPDNRRQSFMPSLVIDGEELKERG